MMVAMMIPYYLHTPPDQSHNNKRHCLMQTGILPIKYSVYVVKRCKYNKIYLITYQSVDTTFAPTYILYVPTCKYV